MKVIELEKIKPGNPFLADFYHMGTQIGINCMAMMENHSNRECKYLIIVDMDTGERLKVIFDKTRKIGRRI